MIYDLKTKVYLIDSRLLFLKTKFEHYNNHIENVNLKTITGLTKTKGMIPLMIKIFNIENFNVLKKTTDGAIDKYKKNFNEHVENDNFNISINHLDIEEQSGLKEFNMQI